MKLTQQATLLLIGLFASIGLVSQVKAQANYPNKPITFVVPYAAGGGSDARSRQIAQRMSALLKPVSYTHLTLPTKRIV